MYSLKEKKKGKNLETFKLCQKPFEIMCIYDQKY